ncbi:hypothetical protein JCM9279_004916 [Rhodotorula babjevae]
MSLSARTHAFFDRVQGPPSSSSSPHPLLAKSLSASPSPPNKPHRPSGTRLRPGTRTQAAFPSSADPFSKPRPLADFDDSPFAVQEYLAELVRRDAHDVDELVRVPVAAAGAAAAGGEGPDQQDGEEGARELIDEQVFCLEHVRRLTLDQHAWLAALERVCTPATCPTMTTTPSWLFVCAAHATPPSPPCSAISYMVHTSEGAQALLTSPRYFPSRLEVPDQGQKLVRAVARRLLRTFAHCHFHHPSLFVHLETLTSLVRRFAALHARFGLTEEDPGELLRGEGPDGLRGREGGQGGKHEGNDEGEAGGEGGWDGYEEELDGLEEYDEDEHGGIRSVGDDSL